MLGSDTKNMDVSKCIKKIGALKLIKNFIKIMTVWLSLRTDFFLRKNMTLYNLFLEAKIFVCVPCIRVRIKSQALFWTETTPPKYVKTSLTLQSMLSKNYVVFTS